MLSAARKSAFLRRLELDHGKYMQKTVLIRLRPRLEVGIKALHCIIDLPERKIVHLMACAQEAELMFFICRPSACCISISN
jgi:hypothetical protein